LADFIISRLEIKAVPAKEVFNRRNIPICESNPALGTDFGTHGFAVGCILAPLCG
jgi:hypothetical protein